MTHDHGQTILLAANGLRFQAKNIDGIFRTRLDRMVISLNARARHRERLDPRRVRRLGPPPARGRGGDPPRPRGHDAEGGDGAREGERTLYRKTKECGQS
jgi:hypothetical protein